MKRLILAISVLVVASGCSAAAAPATTTRPANAAASSTTTVAPPSTATTTTITTTITTTTEPADTSPPLITTVPANGDTVDWFRGDFVVQTEPGATLFVNGESVEPRNDGSYSVAVVNSPGENVFAVAASDAEGNVASERVRYEFAAPRGWVAAIGDSVMLGSKIEIEKRLGEDVVDATVSRQFINAPDLVAEMIARPNPPLVIIVGLGTNGPVQERDFDEVMELAGPGRLMVFVNVRVPRKWEATSNSRLADGVGRYNNAVLVDWYTPTSNQDKLFAADGFHPKQPGRVIMAELIAEAIFPNWEPLVSE